MAVSADLGQFFDREWEDKSLSEILNAPVSALQGSVKAMPKPCALRSTSRPSETWVGTSSSAPLKPLPCSARPEPSRPGRRSACTEVAERELELAAGESVPALGQADRRSPGNRSISANARWPPTRREGQVPTFGPADEGCRIMIKWTEGRPVTPIVTRNSVYCRCRRRSVGFVA